jgi:predicted RNA-binding protein associated with RNAse of E/G family
MANQGQMAAPVPLPGADGPASAIESGEWRDWREMEDYRAEWLTDVLVERATWCAGAAVRTLSPELGWMVAAKPRFIWVRFWFSREDLLVEKYFNDKGCAVGYYVPVCMPLVQEENRMTAQPLGLALWIDPTGRVTVLGEPGFEAATKSGNLTPVAQEQAEHRIRELTTAAAQRRLPPALARNFAVIPEDSQ